MPTYVYRCTKGHEFELFHSMKDDTPKRCPKCRSKAVRVPAAGAGLLFKGSGFYITDYRSKAYSDKAKSEKGDGGSASSGGEKKADAGGSKPASGGEKKKSKKSGAGE